MIGILIAAWLDVRSKPLRTVAAIAGMVAAIVAVVLVDAAGVLSRDANDEYLARNYGLEVTVAITSAGGEIDAEDAARLHEVLAGNGIAYLSPNVNVGLLLEDGGSLGPATLSWVSSAYPDIRIVDMLYGAWPVDTARSDVAHVVITEQRARQMGFSGPDAVGQVMYYTTRGEAGSSSGDIRTDPLRPMIIDGVAATTTNAFDSTSIMIVSDLPRPELMPEFGGMSWLARVNEIDQGTLQNLVSRVADESGSPLFQSQRIDQSAQLAPVLDQQAVTAQVVTLVALTVGGLGILGVGLASVRQGLRAAPGARRQQAAHLRRGDRADVAGGAAGGGDRDLHRRDRAGAVRPRPARRRGWRGRCWSAWSPG
jgi:hypothetical protein